MKAGKSLVSLATAGALALTMAGCSGNGDNGDESTSGQSSTPAESTSAPAEPVTLTVSGWTLSTTPEFQTLADAFHAQNPNITIELKEYDAAQYTDQMIADLSAGSAPDIVTIKEAKTIYQWSEALMDVTDIVNALPSDVGGQEGYTVDGKIYAAPYRNDSWVLFYNKDLFDKAGMAVPNGTWTWDDYVGAAKDLTTKLAGTTAPDGSAIKGTYEHSWQSTLQGFANAQAGDIFSGDYSYMKPYYERALDLQNSGAQETLATITTNKLTYQAAFGKQHAAMMLMGSWFLATLNSQQGTGDADKFTWAIAPVPQVDSSTFDVPVTFGGPTGFAINSDIDSAKLDAAKLFLSFSGSVEAGKALAGIGIVSANASSDVVSDYFSQPGMPTDDVSKTAMTTHVVKPENPVGENISTLQTILNDAHTAIMTGQSPVDAGLADAGSRAHSEGGVS